MSIKVGEKISENQTAAIAEYHKVLRQRMRVSGVGFLGIGTGIGFSLFIYNGMVPLGVALLAFVCGVLLLYIVVDL